MAESGDFYPTRRYHIARREVQKREIRRLIIEQGLSNQSICEKLNIPRRTLERYVSELWSEDSQLLLTKSKEELSLSATIMKERLEYQREQILRLANDQSIDPRDRIAAHNLAADLTVALWRADIDTPLIIRRGTTLDTQTKHLQQKMPEVQLIKHPRSQLPTHYARVMETTTTTNQSL